MADGDDKGTRKRRRRIPSRREVADTARTAAQAILKEHGNNAVAAIADLTDQTYRLRTRLRSMKDSIPKDGDVVLKGDDVKRWEAVKGLNLKPEELAALPTKIADLEKKVAERSDTDLLVEVGDVAKFPRTVLADLAKARGLKYEIKTEKVKVTGKDGKETVETRKVVMVTEKDSTTPVELSAYIEEKAPEYKDRFTKDDKDQSTQGGAGGGGTRRKTFTTQQAASDSSDAEKKTSIDEAIEKNRAAARAPNPLRPAKASA
jgi:hypothetical protein